MLSKYFKTVSVFYNPFTKGGTGARKIISRLPRAQRADKYIFKELEKSSTEPSIVKVVYTDGEKIEVDLNKVSFLDAIERIQRHARQLQIKDMIESDK